MWVYAWVLIPLAGMWSEWLKFKEKQNRLGTTADTLESSFEDLSARLAQRLRS